MCPKMLEKYNTMFKGNLNQTFEKNKMSLEKKHVFVTSLYN